MALLISLVCMAVIILIVRCIGYLRYPAREAHDDEEGSDDERRFFVSSSSSTESDSGTHWMSTPFTNRVISQAQVPDSTRRNVYN